MEIGNPSNALIWRARAELNKKSNTGAILGGMAGGTAAGAVTGGMGTVPALLVGLGGTYTGAVMGDMAQKALDPYQDASWSALKHAATREGPEQVVYDLGGRVVVGGGVKIAHAVPKVGQAVRNTVSDVLGTGKPVVKVSKPSAPMQAVGEMFSEAGGKLTPTQVSDAMSGHIAESIARGGLGTNQMWKQFEQEQQKCAADLARQRAQELFPGGQAMTQEELGRDLFKEVSSKYREGTKLLPGRKWAQVQETSNPIYQKLDQQLRSRWVKGWKYKGDIEVPTGDFDDTGKPIMRLMPQWEKGEEVIGFGPSTEGLKKHAAELFEQDRLAGGDLIPDSLRSTLKAIQAQPERLTFGLMQQLRSGWIKRNRRLGKELDPATQEFDKLIDLATDAMTMEGDSLAKQMPEEAVRLLKNVNRVHAVARDTYREAFTHEMADRLWKRPETSLRTVLGDFPVQPGGEARTERIRLVRDFFRNDAKGRYDPIGDLQWKRIQAASSQAVIRKATAEEKINVNLLRKYMYDMGDRNLLMLHGPEGKTALENTVALGELLARRSENIPWAIRAVQVGSALTPAGILYGTGKWKLGDPVDDAMAISTGGLAMMGPRALARLLTSNRGFKIVKNLTLGNNEKTILSALVRGVQLLREQDMDQYKKMKALTAPSPQQLLRQPIWTARSPAYPYSN